MKGALPEKMEDASDEELMVAYQGGHEEAFMLLYERHSGKVYGFLSVRIGDRITADDAFQATFLKLHSSRDKYDPTLPFAPWLFTICRTAMIDVLRARKRVTSKESVDEVALEVATAPATVESATLPDFGQLPSIQRKALELRYKEDLSFEEIASRLNTTPDNTRQIISRAVRRLKKLVQGEKI